MRPNDTTTQRLWNIAEPVCAGAGYELVDLELTQSRSGWVLRVFIDHPPTDAGHGEPDAVPTGTEGARIGFDDCERVSHELSAVLDVEDPIAHAYSLEVSSPGLDRPLRKLGHFQRFTGRVAKVSLRQGLAGRRNFKGALVGVEHDPDVSPQTIPHSPEAQTATVTINVDGTEYRLPFSDIENARLVPDWDTLFQRRQQR